MTRQWLMDCLDYVALRNEHRVIIDLECSQGRPHCLWKPGMDRNHFKPDGVCVKYELSHPCDEDGAEIEEG